MFIKSQRKIAFLTSDDWIWTVWMMRFSYQYNYVSRLASSSVEASGLSDRQAAGCRSLRMGVAAGAYITT